MKTHLVKSVDMHENESVSSTHDLFDHAFAIDDSRCGTVLQREKSVHMEDTIPCMDNNAFPTSVRFLLVMKS